MPNKLGEYHDDYPSIEVAANTKHSHRAGLAPCPHSPKPFGEIDQETDEMRWLRTYDRKTKEMSGVKSAPSGTKGFISYERLCSFFETEGEVTEHEAITHLEFDDDGIQYRVDPRIATNTKD